MNKDITILGINYKDDSKATLQWLDELGNPYSDVIIDQNGFIGIDWGVYGIPESFIVNTKGIVKHRLIGPITEKNYDDFYLKLFKTLK